VAEGEEKSFPATPRRREEARKKGQVARSHELGGAATLFSLVVALHALLPGTAGASLMADLHGGFLFGAQDTLTLADAQRRTLLGIITAGRLVLPALLLALTLSLVAGIGQVGFSFTPEAAAPQWQRLNPASGLKRLFSLQGSVELLKGILKLALISGICAGSIRDAIFSGQLLGLMGVPLSQSLGVVGQILWTLGLRVSAALLILAVADYAFQRYQNEKSLRMSISEIKQEQKQSEGDPKTKARIRKIQREIARRRMMHDVPKATVVVTNPTHYAIALLYEPGMGAPKVLAKGQDEVAKRIKEIASENRVPLVENRPLAQALHKTVEIGHDVPSELYEAVAQVLAFVYRTYGRRPRKLRV
jgi:flagellar biosynthetic protein FlhB